MDAIPATSIQIKLIKRLAYSTAFETSFHFEDDRFELKFKVDSHEFVIWADSRPAWTADLVQAPGLRCSGSFTYLHKFARGVHQAAELIRMMNLILNT